MPAVIETVVFVVKAIVLGTGPIAKIIRAVVIITASVAYQRQQAKKALRALGGSDNLDAGRMVTVKEPTATRKLIYGQMRVGGTLVFAHVTGTNKEYLHMVVAHAGHECEEIGDVYLNDEIVPLDGSGNATGKYAGYVRVKKHLGADSQTADTDLVSEASGTWTTNHRLRGICYSYWRLQHNPDLFPSGVPNISVVIKGRKIYDPRTTSTAYSNNVALCLRDYLLLSQDRGGLGADSSEVDDAAVIVAANICDESVSLNPSGTESRYTANGVIDTSQEPGVIIQGLLSAMAGICPYVGGVFKMKAGAHTASVVSIGEDDIRAGVSFQTRDSLRDAFNGVKGTYVSALNDYQPADFPAVVNSTYTTEDGGQRRWRDIGLGFTTSSGMAQRLAKIELERSRQDITVQFRTSLRPIEAHVGDVIDLTLARYGWSGKLFEVVDLQFFIEGDDNPILGLIWTVRETASGVWDWSNGEETTVDLAPNTTLVDPYSVPAVSGFTAAAAGSSERTALPRVKLSWSAPTNAAVIRTETQFKKASESNWTDWSSVNADVLFDYVTDLEIGTSYNFRARHVNNRGVRGAWTSPATVTAPSGNSSYDIALSNFRHGVGTTAEGTALSGELGSGGRAVTDVLAWAGNVALSPVASSPGAGQFSFSASVVDGTATITKVDADTVRIDSLGSDHATVRCTVSLEGITTRDIDWVVWKNYAGGSYWLLSSGAAVNKSLAAAYTPSTVTFTGKALLSGAIGAADYSGRFKIATYSAGVWTDVYTSAGDESSKVYTVPAGSFTKFRCQLYKAGGFSTFLDEIEIPITLDGATGAPGSPGSPGAPGADGTDGATVLGSAGGGGSVAASSYTPISPGLSVTITCDGNARIIQLAGGYIANASGSTQTCYAALYRDSSVLVAELGNGNGISLASGQNVPIEFSGIDTPSAGSHTYELRVKGGSGNSVACGGVISAF